MLTVGSREESFEGCARWLAALGAPQMVAESAVPTPAMLITALYAAYYVALEPIAGTTWVACVGAPMCLTATAFQAWAAPSAWVYALAVHAFCWIAQIYPGHAVFERRTLAFCKNPRMYVADPTTQQLLVRTSVDVVGQRDWHSFHQRHETV